MHIAVNTFFAIFASLLLRRATMLSACIRDCFSYPLTCIFQQLHSPTHLMRSSCHSIAASRGIKSERNNGEMSTDAAHSCCIFYIRYSTPNKQLLSLNQHTHTLLRLSWRMCVKNCVINAGSCNPFTTRSCNGGKFAYNAVSTATPVH